VRKTRFGTSFDHFVIVGRRKTRTGANPIAIADRTNIYYIIYTKILLRTRWVTFHKRTIFWVRRVCACVCVLTRICSFDTLPDPYIIIIVIILYPNTSRFHEIVGVHYW